MSGDIVSWVIDLAKLKDDEKYKQGAIDKGCSAELIEEALSVSQVRKNEITATETLRAEANAKSKEIGKASPEEREAKIAAASELKGQLTEAEEKLKKVQEQFDEVVLQIPNPAHETVPVGGEEDFRVESVSGETTPAQKSHGDLGRDLAIVDTERAVRMSGSRFAYVMGDAARLQFGIVQWALAKLDKHGFTPVVTPVLVREEMMEKAGFFPTDKSAVYKVEGDDLYLTGTSEVGLAGIHRDEQLTAEQLPLRYAGYSSCFRREAGTYGKDTSGLFRVHQFDKVEMFVYAHPDESWAELERIREIEEEIISELELPYRVITVASGDLGAAAAKKYDVEVWLPSEQRYREATSCSNYTDFAARRMGSTLKTSEGTQLLHTLNGTATAIGRTLLYIFENHQNSDGSITVPEVLRSFCGGLEVIEPNK